MTGATAVIVVMALGLRVMRLIRVLARSARLSWRRCATWIGGGCPYVVCQAAAGSFVAGCGS